MSQGRISRDPIEALAEQFLTRRRRGEKPTLEEYALRYPTLAEQIRELFPAMVMLEDCKPPATGSAQPSAIGVEQLPDSDSPTPAAPQLGDYRIVREIGRGGMGVVYEAEQLSLRRRVALKILPRRRRPNQKQQQRFEREARAAAKLHHTNIVPVFGVGDQDGVYYYVMQFIQGMSLDAVLAEIKRLQDPLLPTDATGPTSAVEPRRESAVHAAHSLLTGQFNLFSHQDDSGTPETPPIAATQNWLASPPLATGKAAGAATKGQLSDTLVLSDSSVTFSDSSTPSSKRHTTQFSYWQRIAQVGFQVADALQHAHEQKILHRDIKPSNLLVDQRGTVWITDFGLAKESDEQDLTGTGDVLGTLRYMPPEAFEGRADARSDLYSLGLTLYELAALRPAFDDGDRQQLIKRVATGVPPALAQVAREIPRDLATIIGKSIEREPSHRYQTGGEMAADLQRFINDEPIRARKISAVESLVRWARHNRGLAASLCATALLLLLLGSGSAVAAFHFQHQERAQSKLAKQKGVLASANKTLADDAESARRKAVEAQGHEAGLRRDAVEASQVARRKLYFAEMNLAGFGVPDPRGTAHVVELISPWQLQGDESDLRGWEWYYLDSLCHSDRLTLSGPAEVVTSVSFDPSGTRLATGSGDAMARIWDLTTGMELMVLQGHQSWVTCVSWQRHGQRLATASTDQTIKLWDCGTGALVRTLTGHTGGVRSVAWSPDGTQLVSAGDDRSVRLWNAETGEQTQTFSGHDAVVDGVDWSPNGQSIAWTTKDGSVTIKALTGGSVSFSASDPSSADHSLAWSPDSQRLATVCQDRAVRIWDARTGTASMKLEGHLYEVAAVAWSPDGAQLATASRDKSIRVWDSANGKQLKIIRGHVLGVMALSWSPDGHQLASGSRDGTAKIWDLSADAGTRRLRGNEGATKWVAWAPDGTQLATAGDDHLVRIWDRASGRELQSLAGHTQHVGCVAWSTDGKKIASASEDHTIRLWETATGRTLHSLSGHTDQVFSVAWHPDGSRIASAGIDHLLKVWDTETGAEIRSFELPVRLGCAAWSPDGRRLACSGHSRSIWIVEVENGKVAELPMSADPSVGGIVWLAWSPDGTRLATASSSGVVNVCNSTNGQDMLSLRGHLSWSNCVAWSPDGRRLASSSEDSTVRIWDPADGTLALTLVGQEGWYSCVAWSPDGTALATASYGDAVLLRLAENGYLRARSPAALPILDRRLAENPHDIEALRARSETYTRLKQVDRADRDVAQARSIAEQRVKLNAEDGGALLELIALISAEAQRRRADAWQVIEPREIKSEGGATLTILKDRSILAGGFNPDSEVYSLVLDGDWTNVTALRLETLPHDSLPNSSSGRSPGNGNFLLADFRVAVAPADGQAVGPPLRFSQTFCDFVGQDGRRIEHAIDGDSATHWTVFPALKSPHCAVFQFSEPFDKTVSRLMVRMDFRGSNWKQHALGHFRLSATTSEQPALLEAIRFLGPRRPNLWSRLGALYFLIGDFGASAEALQESCNSQFGPAPYERFLLALAQHRQQLPAAAQASIDQACGLLRSDNYDELTMAVACEALMEIRGLSLTDAKVQVDACVNKDH